MVDWWIGSLIEGEQVEFDEEPAADQYQEENFEEGKCSKGPLYPWTL